MISTPLRMEKPVRRPIVPPIRPRAASVVTSQVVDNNEFCDFRCKRFVRTYKVVFEVQP